MRLKIFLLLLSATMVGTGLWLKWEERKEILAAVEAHNKRWSPDFDLNSVAAVWIKTNENSLLIQKEGNAWKIQNDTQLINADVAAIGQLVNSVKNLKPIEEIEIDPARFADFEIMEPDGVSKNTGTLLELRDNESKRIAALVLGKKSFARPDPNSPFPPASNGRFIRLPSASGVLGVVSKGFDKVSTDPEAWIDRSEKP